MKPILNGKTWIAVLGLGFMGMGFASGWIAKRETAAQEIGAARQELKELEAWRQEHMSTTATPGMERLRKVEIGLAGVEARMAGLEAITADIRGQIGELRGTVREIRRP